MFKLLLLLSIAVVIYAKRDREMKDIPGVSAENMAKLRELMNPRPASREDFKKKMEEWMSSLPEAEQAAAKAHREEMRKRFKERRGQHKDSDSESGEQQS